MDGGVFRSEVVFCLDVEARAGPALSLYFS
jgi:hypothetical protein